MISFKNMDKKKAAIVITGLIAAVGSAAVMQYNTGIQQTSDVVEGVVENDILTSSHAYTEDGSYAYTGSSIKADSTGEKIAYSYNITIEAKDVRAVKNTISSKLSEYDGYANSEYYDNGAYILDYKVPSENVSEFVSYIDTYDVVSESSSVEDKTLSYIDKESRIRTKREVVKQYEELLEKAETVDEIMSVHEKMDSVIEDIESYESEQKAIERSVQYSNVSLMIQEPEKSFIAQAFEKVKSSALFLIDFALSLLSVIPPIAIALFLLVKVIDFAARSPKKRSKTDNSIEEFVEIIETPEEVIAADKITA